MYDSVKNMYIVFVSCEFSRGLYSTLQGAYTPFTGKRLEVFPKGA